MAYIRTKNGIYRTTKNFVVGKEHYVAWHDFYEEIINQADTIEELCDRYYGVDENGDVYRVHNWSKDSYPSRPHEWAVDGFCYKEDITISELKNRFPKGIFGAIVWFDDNGNLHIDIVAKMNDKGELELL